MIYDDNFEDQDDLKINPISLLKLVFSGREGYSLASNRMMMSLIDRVGWNLGV